MVVNMFLQLLIFIIIITNAGMSLPCAPGEVTQPYTFTANISQQNYIVLWRRNDANIAICSTSNKCTQLGDRNIYEATRSGQITSLQIKNVTTQSGGMYTCESDTSEMFNCDFKVYAKPDSVTCQDPEFRAVTQDVAVVCTVQRIYPNPVCRFLWFINNTESLEIQKNLVEYNNLTGSESSSYINQNCSFNLPARDFILGKHQFQLTVYPNITGQDSDAVYGNKHLTSQKFVVSPNATLNCSDTTVQENKQVSCTCTETANTFILATTTLFYGTANISSSLQHITAPITGNRYTSEILCQTQLPAGTKTNKTQSLQVYFGPNIFNFEVNKNSEQVILEGSSIVGFSCQAEGNPSPKLTLRKNGAELAKFTYPTRKFNLTLIYNIPMAECLDTGVYMCLAETGKTAAYTTVAVYVKCAQQLRNADSLSHIYKGQVNHQVLISVPVFGFPEPNVTLYSTNYTLYPGAYNLTYIKQEPPYGTVSLMIHIGNSSFFQHYSLNVVNSEGQLTYLFEIVEGEISGDGSPDQDVGAIVGGVVAAVLVIVVIAGAIFLLKRKGAPCKPKDHQCANTSVHKPYENAESGVLPDAQAPENPHYEEIIHFQTDVPDKPVYYTNQTSNIQHAKVDYQNTV